MSTPERSVTIVAPPQLPIIEITRDFAAPAAAVFAAHVDPDLFVRWIGPADIEAVVQRWDPVTGGGYRYVARRGSEEYGFHGCFHEVREPDRIVQTFGFDGEPDAVTLEVLTLTDLPGGGCRLHVVSGGHSVAERDAMMASGMAAGIEDGYRKLDALLSAGDPGDPGDSAR